MSRRRAHVFSLLALALALRGCAGTSTGNGDCPVSGWCKWPVGVTFGELGFRGSFWLDETGPDLFLRGTGYSVDQIDGQCVETGETYFDIRLDWENADSTATPDGGLHVSFDGSAALPPSVPTPRPSLVFTEGDENVQFGALRMDLNLTPGGELEATLTAVQDFPSTATDGGAVEIPVEIRGSVSVECAPGERQRAIPTGSGEARIRCAQVPAPQPECNDTVTNTGCGMRSVRGRLEMRGRRAH